MHLYVLSPEWVFKWSFRWLSRYVIYSHWSHFFVLCLFSILMQLLVVSFKKWCASSSDTVQWWLSESIYTYNWSSLTWKTFTFSNIICHHINLCNDILMVGLWLVHGRSEYAAGQESDHDHRSPTVWWVHCELLDVSLYECIITWWSIEPLCSSLSCCSMAAWSSYGFSWKGNNFIAIHYSACEGQTLKHLKIAATWISAIGFIFLWSKGLKCLPVGWRLAGWVG